MIALLAAFALTTTLPPAAVPLPPVGLHVEAAPSVNPVALRPEPILILAEAPPGEVSCDDSAVPVTSAVTPASRTSITFATLHAEEAEARLSMAFRITPEGRALDIHQLPQPQAGGVQSTFPDEDEAALAVWRFAPSAQGHQGCHVAFRSRTKVLSQASPSELYPVIAAAPNPGAITPAVLDQAGLGGGTCRKEPRSEVLEAHYPDPDAIPGEPGQPLWVIYSFDLDAHGRRVNIRRVAGETTPKFDQATRGALAAGRNQPKPRTGCMVIYRHAAATLPAPPPLRPAEADRNQGTCPGGDLLSYPTAMIYPQRFANRGVEGWAFIGFDVAPWGAIGNIRVLAAEPADAFGTSAQSRVALAKVKTPGRAYTDCVLPVHFKMPSSVGPPNVVAR